MMRLRQTDTVEDMWPLVSFHGSASLEKNVNNRTIMCVFGTEGMTQWCHWGTSDGHKQVCADTHTSVCVCFVSGEWLRNLPPSSGKRTS